MPNLNFEMSLSLSKSFRCGFESSQHYYCHDNGDVGMVTYKTKILKECQTAYSY